MARQGIRPRLLQHGRPFHLCARRTRTYSTPSDITTLPATIPRAAHTILPSRRLISLQGPDVVPFLQGCLTYNVTPSPSKGGGGGGGFYAAFLNARGRVAHDVFVYRDDARATAPAPRWLIEVDAAHVDRLAQHMAVYKLRKRVRVRVLAPAEATVWTAWREPERDERRIIEWERHGLHGAGGQAVKGANEDGFVLPDGVVGCRDGRAPGMGWRLVLTADQDPEQVFVHQQGRSQVASQDATEMMYTIRRYLRGVPEGPSEILHEEALPQESNIDFMGGIDYRKGCYVGQELTIRTHHTGVVRRRILPLLLYERSASPPTTMAWDASGNVEAASISPGSKIHGVGKTGRAPGKWLAGVGNVGLGLCRLDAMTDVRMAGEPGSFESGDEFKMDWVDPDGLERTSKVKAFVPSWHLTPATNKAQEPR